MSYRIRPKRTWYEYYMRQEPNTAPFWKFIANMDMNLAFCSQDCATKFTDKYRMDYLMFLTENGD